MDKLFIVISIVCNKRCCCSKTNKIARLVGRVQILKKFTSTYLFEIARGKSCDYLLIIYMQTFHLYCTHFTFLHSVWDECSKPINRLKFLHVLGINKQLSIFQITNCTRPTSFCNYVSLRNLLVLIYIKLHWKSCDYLFKKSEQSTAVYDPQFSSPDSSKLT